MQAIISYSKAFQAMLKYKIANTMRYYLSDKCVLKWLERPSIYNIREDELYELDEDAFWFFKECASDKGCENIIADDEFINYCISEGILAEHPVNVKRPLLIKSYNPSLRYIELQITDKCNLKCRHCYIGKPKNDELTLDEIKAVLDEFEIMQGLRLLITGGEPLMHKNFEEINILLPEYQFRKVLFTNGLLLNKNILKVLNIDEIQFSVDGMEHGHEAIRGKGAYKRVMQAIRDAIDLGMAVSIATMVHRENLNEFDEMNELFRRLKIKDWTVDVPCIEGSLKKNKTLWVSPEIAGKYLNYGFEGGLHGGGEGYACGLHLLSVLANKKICKCSFYFDEAVGTLKDGIRKAWERIRPLRLEDLECSSISCQFINSCRGGCRFRAKIATQDERKRDIYKCYGYGIL